MRHDPLSQSTSFSPQQISLHFVMQYNKGATVHPMYLFVYIVPSEMIKSKYIN